MASVVKTTASPARRRASLSRAARACGRLSASSALLATGYRIAVITRILAQSARRHQGGKHKRGEPRKTRNDAEAANPAAPQSGASFLDCPRKHTEGHGPAASPSVCFRGPSLLGIDRPLRAQVAGAASAPVLPRFSL